MSQNLSNIKWKTGDILFVDKGTKWGDLVGWFQGNRFHHCGFIILLFNEVYVFEAIAFGMAFTPIDEFLDKRNNKGWTLLVKRHIDSDIWSRVMRQDLCNFCLRLTDRPYEFTNLVGFQAVRFAWYKLTKRSLWIGRSKDKSKGSMICSELVGLIYHEFLGMFKNNWWKLAPIDIYNHKNLHSVLYLKGK